MADNRKIGRVVGTAAAVVLVVSVLTIIYMATRPNVPSPGNSSLHLLPPPASEPQSR